MNKEMYERMEQIFGEGTVAVSNTGSKDGFAKDWGDMDGDISRVLIMAHGKNQSINLANNNSADEQITSTGDGKTNISGADATNV